VFLGRLAMTSMILALGRQQCCSGLYWHPSRRPAIPSSPGDCSLDCQVARPTLTIMLGGRLDTSHGSLWHCAQAIRPARKHLEVHRHSFHSGLHNILQNLHVRLRVDLEPLLKELERHDVTLVTNHAQDHHSGHQSCGHHNRGLSDVSTQPFGCCFYSPFGTV
jgi:hypothetical protein